METALLPNPAFLPTPATPNIPLLAKIPAVRRRLAYERMQFFLPFYFSDYITYQTAPFQLEMTSLLQNGKVNPLVISAFRGACKSTYVSLVYVLYAIMCSPQKKYVLLVSQTQEQARQILKNIRVELERNALLRDDLGPFREEEDEWRNATLVISKFNARITAISVGQSMRGLRHENHRPDLLVLDDLENLESVKTRESRDKTWNWLMGDAVPAGDGEKTRVVVVGSHLHEDSVLQRYRKAIERNGTGAYRSYPLLDEQGNPLWPAKYPDSAAIEALKQSVPDEVAFLREYMLMIVSPESQVIRKEWIQRYDPSILPPRVYPSCAFTGVDPAVSEKESADYTGIVSAYILNDEKDKRDRIYILPNVMNKRMDVVQLLEELKKRSLKLGQGSRTKIFTEVQGQQGWLEQLLRRDRMSVEGIHVGSEDKRTRLAALAQAVQAGDILFPQKGYGADHLIEQITGFGTERHDDLMDAFSLLCNQLVKKLNRPGISLGHINPRTGMLEKVNLEDIQKEAAHNLDVWNQYWDYRQAFVKATGMEAFAGRY